MPSLIKLNALYINSGHFHRTSMIKDQQSSLHDIQTYKEGRQRNIINWPLYLWRKCKNKLGEKISAVCSLAANGHFDSFVTIAGHDIDKMCSSGIVRRASFYMAHQPVTSFIWFCCRRIACFHKIIILKSSVWAVHTSLY